MRVGAWFPQAEIGADAGEARAFLEGVHELGYAHVQVLDHVLGAHRASHPEMDYLPYDETALLHEPLVLFGFAAAAAPGLELATAILVLPQRQTALAAKQLAEVDRLSGGRLRVGVGVGWNPVEYEALGMGFDDRGRRVEEQVALLRRLWTEPVVDFDGEHHRVRAAGLNPLPVQRPIPVWIGGTISRARRRAATIGDGYVMPWPLPPEPLESEWPQRLEEMRAWRREARGAEALGVEARLSADLDRSPEQWRQTAEDWRTLGATHLAVKTTGLGLRGADAHLERLALARKALEDLVAVTPRG